MASFDQTVHTRPNPFLASQNLALVDTRTPAQIAVDEGRYFFAPFSAVAAGAAYISQLFLLAGSIKQLVVTRLILRETAGAAEVINLFSTSGQGTGGTDIDPRKARGAGNLGVPQVQAEYAAAITATGTQYQIEFDISLPALGSYIWTPPGGFVILEGTGLMVETEGAATIAGCWEFYYLT